MAGNKIRDSLRIRVTHVQNTGSLSHMGLIWPVSFPFSEAEFISSTNMSIPEVMYYSLSGWSVTGALWDVLQSLLTNNLTTPISEEFYTARGIGCVWSAWGFTSFSLPISCYHNLFLHVWKKNMKMLQVITLLLCEISHKEVFWNVTACAI